MLGGTRAGAAMTGAHSRFNSYTLGSVLRCKPSKVAVAVDRLCFVAEESRVLALLGVRGARCARSVRPPA